MQIRGQCVLLTCARPTPVSSLRPMTEITEVPLISCVTYPIRAGATA